MRTRVHVSYTMKPGAAHGHHVQVGAAAAPVTLPRSESRHVRSDTEINFQRTQQYSIVAEIPRNRFQIIPDLPTTNISLF